jgi:AcrR family transcriptional regulator
LLDTVPSPSLQFSGLTGQFHVAADVASLGGQTRSDSPRMKVAMRTPRQTAKREHIVGAASRVFAARPYHVVCMDDVAEAARVGKGTLYRYFPSKEDLYLGVVAGAFDLLIRRLERVEAEELPPSIVLSRMIEAIVETFARHLAFFRLMQQGEARLFLRKRQVVRERRDRIADGLARILDRGAQTGVFRKVDRDLGPSMLIGLVWGTVLNHAGETPAELLAQRVADLCLHGILQAPGETL